ncbi:flavin reductase family protein [Polynucleobacter sp. IMCC 29146]|uniref:flavin reductase family protein n=1 Tax=Polynucleobacter sp. IMCC 29146 TaxID=2780953 RepID=UPI001F15EA53|nr:flavin reductase family protein [Polynucleobacter sp. IMCC 29146]MCE7529714.1 flavin reductase family protein [Polynucleobacter sp. IMCC 29146]
MPSSVINKPISSGDLRQGFAAFPTGVTVITGLDATQAPIGITISSFNTVSLNPPLVLWSIAKQSPLAAAFSVGAQHIIHVLNHAQEDLAITFAKRRTGQFATVNHLLNASGIPFLQGCAAHFECETVAVYPGGDHLIIVAQIHDLAHDPAKAPLLFHRSELSGIKHVAKE